MSSFSSVVRKPGQKITPKTAPRRHVQRSSAKPDIAPSLPPESHAASPGPESVEHRAQNQEDILVPTILESTELPATTDSAEASIPVFDPPEAFPTPTPEPETTLAPSISVEVYAPSSTSEGISIIHPAHSQSSRPALDAIPPIASSASTRARRRNTNEPTPTPSVESRQTAENDPVETDTPALESRKRRKITHSETIASTVEPFTTPPLSEATTRILRSRSRSRRSESRTSDALLQDATSQAAAVSELANSIEARARSLRSRSTRLSPSPTDDDDDEASESARRPKKKSRAKTIEDVAQQVIDAAIGGKGGHRSRMSTPENAEQMQIDPEEVSMGDLTRDNKLGKKSETEKRMQENWADIQERRKEEVTRRREAAGQGRHGLAPTANPDAAAEETHVPQQIIVNGQIVVAAESREVAFGAGVEQAVIEDVDVALEDDRIYNNVNQNTVGKHAGLRRGTRWDDEKTELFYKGLRWFGTDFSMIANFFPQIDRRQVKLKFTVEMRAEPVRVRECVAAKEPVDMDEYMKMTEQEFIDPDALQAELDATEKQLREEDERKREKDGFGATHDPSDIAIPSTEQDDENDEADGDLQTEDDGQPQSLSATAHKDRLSALADRVVNAAVAPKKKATAQQQRKTREPTGSGRGRQRKKSRLPMEGVEERIGPVNEVG